MSLKSPGQRFRDAVKVGGAEEGVDVGQLRREGVADTTGQTAGDDQTPLVLLQRRHLVDQFSSRHRWS